MPTVHVSRWRELYARIPSTGLFGSREPSAEEVAAAKELWDRNLVRNFPRHIAVIAVIGVVWRAGEALASFGAAPLP